MAAVHPRLITENACVALTRRTSFRKGFLLPWAGASGDVVESSAAEAWSRGASTVDKTTEKPRWDSVGQTFAYAAALAQRATGLDWHQLVLVGSHHHSQATPRDRELAESTRVLHRTTSCALNSLLREKGFEAPGSVWDKRQTHWMTLVDVAAVSSRLVYDDLNCVAAGWVEHPLDVPFGQHLGFELWNAGGIAVPKPDNAYFSKRMPKEIELRLTPPIALVRKFGRDTAAIVAFLHELREERIAQIAEARFGPVRGVKKMRELHPWDEPDTDKELIGRIVPSFAVGQPGEEGERVRIQCKLDTKEHRGSHAERIGKWKQGDRTSPFPSGTLRGHTFLGMPLDVPAFGAILGVAHPSRQEVEAELEAKWAQRARLEEERRERLRVREERRARAEKIAEEEDFERELEEMAGRVRVAFDPKDPLRKPVDVSGVIDALTPTKVVRRGLGESRPRADEGGRAVVLRTREAQPSRKRRRRRGANDPPE